MRKFIREKLWDCPSCKNVCRGRHTHCPECGSPRPKNVVFRSVRNGPEVKEADLLALAHSGASINCSHCGSDFPGNGKYCGSCGNERDTSDYVRGSETAAPVKHRLTMPADRGLGLKFILLMILGGLGLAYAFWYFVLDTKKFSASVTGVSWERKVSVIGLGKEQSGWDPPRSGVKIISSKMILRDRKEISHYKVVGKEPGKVWGKIGEKEKPPKDLNNGFEEVEMEDVMGWKDGMVDKKEPVYKKPKKEPFYVWRPYEVVRTPISDGKDFRTYWPSLRLGTDESEGSKSESYVVYFRSDDGKNYSYTIGSESEWRKCVAGSRWRLSKNRLGGILGIERM